MSDFDELIDALSETIRMKTKGAELNLPVAYQQWEDYYQEKRKALTDAISAVTSERDILQKREYELLTIISNGKKVKANAIYDFDRYQTAINAGYVDGLLYEHRARLAKDAS
jgi:hypothetical protein